MNHLRISALTALLVAGVAVTGWASGYGDKGSAMEDGSKKAGMMAAETVSAPEYTIDAVHSTIGFAVKHLQVATTRGKFNDYTGVIHYDPENLDAFKADVTIQAASIDTDNEQRDAHLVSGDFFAVDEYPTIMFKSTRLDDRGGNLVMVGDLTIRGVTKQVTFPVEIAGPVQSPFGQTVVALSAQFDINRQDYGVSWSKSMDNGGLVVDDTVTLIAEFELHQK